MTFNSLSIDRLYVWLGYFTNLYLALIAAEFFSNFHRLHPALEHILDAFSEPYLGALAVYVVLKEIGKRRGGPARSLRRGEWFVIAWLVLLASTTLAVALTDFYRFDVAYRLIISNALASFIIYLGARIPRP